MHPTQGTLATFLNEFARNSAACDVPRLVSQFADTFLAAGPDGARAVTGAQFAAALPKRKEMFDRWGCTSTALDSFDETPLDARYTLARTTWRLNFSSEGKAPQEILLHSTFLIDSGGESPKIVLYLSNSDVVAVLRERGIVNG